MMEIWKPVRGFEGLYSVSNTGSVRREGGKTSNGRNWKQRILRPRVNQDGYVKYTLYRGGKPNYVLAHRLVCSAFHGEAPEGKPFALHRDDNPENNTPENLYWGNLSDNQGDILLNGNNYGRNKRQCVNGHEYTESNTYINRKTGHRSCQTCRRQYTEVSNGKRKRETENRVTD